MNDKTALARATLLCMCGDGPHGYTLRYGFHTCPPMCGDGSEGVTRASRMFLAPSHVRGCAFVVIAGDVSADETLQVQDGPWK